MRAIVVGLGVQGYKRRKFAGAEYVAATDPVNPEADFKSVEDVPLESYDSALVCVPDEPKVELLRYLLSHGKHVLIEKPLWAARDEDISALESIARAKNAVCYVAYNHRFEPHYVRMRDLIASGELGRLYSCRMFYGNGTARLVRESAWRDQGAGVLPDLGSHLLDTCRFWFGDIADTFRVVAANRFENKAPDHVVIGSEENHPRIELEMTLLMWRNYFTCDVLAEKGSAHIESLCKWGPSTFRKRIRVLPSGKPREELTTLPEGDPTWALEYAHFRELCQNRVPADLSNDLWLQRTLRRLSGEALR
ncbi:MAG TPA: Gfo/Idh/MocA family oxidoreductase [Candidatus Binataceae bacterium]|nr:Gfo/Idh/MocA family oxidoreductase [Candidatus Binataceae bacterium]